MITIETCAVSMKDIIEFSTFETADKFLITLIDEQSDKLNLVFGDRDKAEDFISKLSKSIKETE